MALRAQSRKKRRQQRIRFGLLTSQVRNDEALVSSPLELYQSEAGYVIPADFHPTQKVFGIKNDRRRSSRWLSRESGPLKAGPTRVRRAHKCWRSESGVLHGQFSRLRAGSRSGNAAYVLVLKLVDNKNTALSGLAGARITDNKNRTDAIGG